MAGQSLRFVATGWVRQTYIKPGYNFTFIGFEWLNALHGQVMYFYFALMALAALLVSAGLCYRWSAVLLALLWTTIYLSCKTHYNNHYYLMVLLCWMMVVMPAGKRFSLDVRLKYTAPACYCFRWQLWLFILQTSCIYIFAAIAKLNADWLHAIPLKMWLHAKAGRPYIGWAIGKPVTPWLIAYGGLLFDLAVIPGLLYSRTRKWFFVLSIAFHVFNGIVFQIGTFPFLALSLCVFFFPARVYDRVLGKCVADYTLCVSAPARRRRVNYCIALYVALQLFLPVRHWLMPGPVGWTGEGSRMAWQMMLRSKRGTVYFKIKNKQTGNTWIETPETFIKQESRREVAVLPDVTWQAAQVLKKKYNADGIDVAIYAFSSVSLNYRPAKALIDTAVDLANVRWNYWGHNDWVLLK